MLNQKSDGSFNFNRFDSPENAASSLVQKLLEQTHEFIEEKGRCVWAVSGGSTILKVYDALAARDNLLKKITGKLTVIWVDERVVPHTHANSNYGSAYNYFWNRFENAELLAVPYHQHVEVAAEQYNSILKAHGIGSGDIDITILGMGTDGHTASLFPHNPGLNERDQHIIPVEDPSVQFPRISMTYPFINSSKYIYLLFYGEEKAKTFRQAVNSGSVKEYPIMGVMKNNLDIFTDQSLSL